MLRCELLTDELTLTGSGSGWDASEVQRIENASEVTELQRENKSPTIQREFVSGSIGTVK